MISFLYSFVVDILYMVAFLVALPWLLYRMVVHKRYREGWRERFGFVERRLSGRGCIWIHAVSMGEINAIASLVKRLCEVLPQYEIVISSTTDTGINRARKLYGGRFKVFFFPWDFSFAVRRAFRRLRPELCIMMELELWPNFTAVANQYNIPVVVANGRISSGKGFPRYKRFAAVLKPIFRRASMVLAQDKQYAERFAYLGVPAERIRVVGSLKYDTANTDTEVPGSDVLAKALHIPVAKVQGVVKLEVSCDSNAPVWVAGSTGPGEEEIILHCYGELLKTDKLKSLRLIIVPRKPERFNQVAELIATFGFKLVRLSTIKKAITEGILETEFDCSAVILGDTMGDLRKLYSLADVIFVGRSLVPMGGSDMIEAAGLAKPVVVGPYTENFTQAVQQLMVKNAIEMVADGRQLIEVVRELLLDCKKADEMAMRAREVIVSQKGATDSTVAAIVELLGYRMPVRKGCMAMRCVGGV